MPTQQTKSYYLIIYGNLEKDELSIYRHPSKTSNPNDALPSLLTDELVMVGS